VPGPRHCTPEQKSTSPLVASSPPSPTARVPRLAPLVSTRRVTPTCPLRRSASPATAELASSEISPPGPGWPLDTRFDVPRGPYGKPMKVARQAPCCRSRRLDPSFHLPRRPCLRPAPLNRALTPPPLRRTAEPAQRTHPWRPPGTAPAPADASPPPPPSSTCRRHASSWPDTTAPLRAS
jgi:hypothetical protein